MKWCQSSNTYLLPSTRALMNLSDDCWTTGSIFASVVELAINR